jgi:hypothetical protein
MAPPTGAQRVHRYDVAILPCALDHQIGDAESECAIGAETHGWWQVCAEIGAPDMIRSDQWGPISI